MLNLLNVSDQANIRDTSAGQNSPLNARCNNA
jgi:hypothetical protein